jgi:hypothetical protein
VVRTRANRANDLVRLRGREDELQVRRWLLHDFEQGVEALRGDHVSLVENKDLEPVARGAEGSPFAQVASIVNTTV